MELEADLILLSLAATRSGDIAYTANKIRARSRYLVNDAYNHLWIYKCGIPANQPMQVEEMAVEADSKAHAQPFMTVWFKNIDRLLAKLSGPEEEYSFIDIGCGRGLAALYVARHYNFESLSGLDFEHSLIVDAHRNQHTMADFTNVDFFVADATAHELPDRKYVVFMFNPFDAPVMQAFMENNIDSLRRNKSVIAYANYHQLDVIKSFEPASIKMIEDYRCALIAF